MRDHYVTFGQEHVHSACGKTFDKDCVAVFKAKDSVHGREKTFKLFGAKFCMEYHDSCPNMTFFSRGLIRV